MSLESAIALIDSVADDRVLFVGEISEDVYQYCEPLGRPVKDLIICVQQCKTERWHGGIVAAAHHAEDFCAAVDVWSDRSIVKTRFVEQAHFRKLFQVYGEMQLLTSNEPLSIEEYDAVCLIDYGHGMMDDERRMKIEHDAKFLSLNVQTNAGNYGFNLATKYWHCDYLVVDETEARLATQNQFGPIQHSLYKLNDIAQKVVITLGVNGAIGRDKKTRISALPAMTTSIVDTMGAGDAFFAVTAPMARTGSVDDLLLIGNAAGALKAQSIGHSKPVTKTELISYLKERHGPS